MTPDALARAMQEHADYVNATADRKADIHFEDSRLNALVEQ
jgi:hypothetical protein